jgi:hypothetical protein
MIPDTRPSDSEVLRELKQAADELSVRIHRLGAPGLSAQASVTGQESEEDSQEIEAYAAFLRAEEHLITLVMRRQLTEPVDPGDRHTIAKVVLGLLQRTNKLENQLRVLASKQPLDL